MAKEKKGLLGTNYHPEGAWDYCLFYLCIILIFGFLLLRYLGKKLIQLFLRLSNVKGKTWTSVLYLLFQALLLVAAVVIISLQYLRHQQDCPMQCMIL